MKTLWQLQPPTVLTKRFIPLNMLISFTLLPSKFKYLFFLCLDTQGYRITSIQDVFFILWELGAGEGPGPLFHWFANSQMNQNLGLSSNWSPLQVLFILGWHFWAFGSKSINTRHRCCSHSLTYWKEKYLSLLFYWNWSKCWRQVWKDWLTC